MLKGFLLFKLLFLPLYAEPNSQKMQEALIAGDLDYVLKQCHKNSKMNLSNSQICSITLITEGDLTNLQKLLSTSLEHHKSDPELLNISNHLDLFTKDFDHIQDPELKKYFEINLEEIQIQEIANLKTYPYLLHKLDYLIAKNTKESFELAENLANQIINSKQEKIFNHSMDLYELASAYKTLAILKTRIGQIEEAKDLIKIAKLNIYRMKSLWIEEDFFVYDKIWKTTERKTKFGYLFPQWLMILRQEYDNYLLPSQ